MGSTNVSNGANVNFSIFVTKYQPEDSEQVLPRLYLVKYLPKPRKIDRDGSGSNKQENQIDCRVFYDTWNIPVSEFRTGTRYAICYKL